MKLNATTSYLMVYFIGYTNLCYCNFPNERIVSCFKNFQRSQKFIFFSGFTFQTILLYFSGFHSFTVSCGTDVGIITMTVMILF